MTVDPTNTGITPTPEQTPAPQTTTAPPVEQTPAPEAPPPTDREVKLAEQHQKARERRIRDEAAFTGQDPEKAVEADRAARTKPEEGEGEQRARDAQGRFAPKQGEGADTAPAAPEPEFEVVVDGKKVKVKQSELLRGYSHRAAAEQKFREAAALREEIERRMAQGGGQQVATQAQGTGNEAEIAAFKVKVKGADGQVRETTFGDATAYGTPDEINQATAQLLQAASKAQAGAITPEQLETHLWNRERTASDVRFVNEFVATNQHVFADPDFATLAREHTVSLMREDLANNVPEYREHILRAPPQEVAARHALARRTALPMRSLEDLMKAGRDHVAGKFSLKAPDAAKATADRRDLKRQTHQPPPPTSARQPPISEAPTRKSAADIARDMRARRGQHVGAA